MSAAKKILIAVTILCLLLTLIGGILYGVYRHSTTHHEVGKAGLGLLIGGGVASLLSVIGLIVYSMQKKKSTNVSSSSE